MKTLKVLAATAMLTMVAAPAFAANFDVQMLNKGEAGTMVFEPALIEVQPGDTVRFVPTDKGHDAESIPGMVPDGATPFKGQISQEVSVKFDKPGLYGYRCVPHFGMGMVGLIAVGGDTSNLEAARQAKMPPIATKRMAVLLDQAAQSKTAESGATGAAR